MIVLGLDGVDPEVVDLLMSEGKLPNFARLRQGGAYGRLESSKPLLSPIIWTTIATGKTPLEHGIGHFVAVNEKTGAQLPVTSQMRRVKALWNILSGAGREVAVVGWWATWPAEQRARRRGERPHLLPLPLRRGREREQRSDRRDASARAARTRSRR